MKRLLIGVVVALVSGLLFASLASAKVPAEVKVALSEFKVEISTVELPAGAAVTYIITNNGKLKHEMVLEKAGAVDEPLEFAGKGQEAEDIEPGTTRTVAWTIPEAGSYQLACHIEGHFEAGMKTTFTTTAAVPAAQPAAAQAAAPAEQLPKTAGESQWWSIALGLLALLVLAIGFVLRSRKAA